MKIFKDPDVAKFFWGDKGVLPTIDELNCRLESNEGKYYVIPVRFSIGAILFRREFFDKMGMYDVDRRGSNMGMDELQICHYCVDSGNVMIVALDTVVGHFSFGSQNKAMEKY